MTRRTTRPRVSLRVRSLTPTLDSLESRQLLTTTPGLGPLTQGPTTAGPLGPTMHPMFDLGRLAPASASYSGAGYTPAQIQQAYGFSKIAFGSVKGDGTGQTIAIVDAQDAPNVQADLNAFDAQFQLPNTTVTRVNQTGGTSYPAVDSTGGWEMEIALDVEWAHAVAPGAKILLVEANSSYDNDLLAGVSYASAHANVVSMSWGGGEFSGESSYDSTFNTKGVAFVSSSGDNGAPISWPAASPNVVAVGGTSLNLTGTNTIASESGWGGSGGGPSAYLAQPNYQSGVVTQTTMRANPDVAYDAAPSTGFAVYDSYPYNGTAPNWTEVGGTSAGAPQWAALLSIADQGRALGGLPALDSTSPQDVQTTLYKNAGTAAFHDVTTGSSTGTTPYSAAAGYDYVTGIGTPAADLVVQALAGTPTTQAPGDHLVFAAAASDTAGASYPVTVTAVKSDGTTDAAYTGTLHFTSSDAQAGLPANYTFTTTDAGSHAFTLTLKTAGSQSVSAADAANSAVSGTLTAVAVSPAAASQILLGLPSTTTAGAPMTATVTAKDPYGNLATGDSGTVHFTSSDAQAKLPADTVFPSGGKGNFTVTLQTPGSQSVTVTDTASATLAATRSGISVSPTAPVLAAPAVVSNTQINLSWTGPAGTTTLIERSSGGGWAQIGTTAAGVNSDSDTGLTPGTTYSYRLRASSGTNATSAYSNTASATTTTTGIAAPGTLWANTYTPSQDQYGSGSYELGVKIRPDVSGTVTGVRFYKQTWMNGYTHVGHLWTSSGTLLATATFTNETSYGWEQVKFSSPVTVAANTVYVVSFSTGGGYYGVSSTYFSNSGVDSGHLHALANTNTYSAGDGVYHTGNGSFPGVSGGGMNFWADVVFSPSSATPASAPAASPSSQPSAPVVAAKAASVPADHPAAQSARAVTVYTDSWSYRRGVAQAITPATAHPNGDLFFGRFVS